MQVTAGDAKSYGQECLYPMNRCATVERVAGVRVASQTGVPNHQIVGIRIFRQPPSAKLSVIQDRKPNSQRTFADAVNADESPERRRLNRTGAFVG